jgi:hypothetical protein
VDFSPELDLVTRCCRRNFLGADGSIAIPAGVDWQRFLRLVRFHRVQGLAWRALGGSRECPAEVADALSADATRIAAANLESAAESARILAAFQAANVPILFVKGLTLAVLAYGDAASKSAIDIDLLIRPSDLEVAGALLRGLEYRLAVRAGSDNAALRLWHGTRKESDWIRRGAAIAVDLHTRLADNPRVIAGVDAASPSVEVDIGNGIALPTLARDELFSYLAAHGASSAWFRLKWITDFTALVSPLNAAELTHLYWGAHARGAGRAAGQALLLSDSLFGSLGRSPDLRNELLRNGAIRRLHRAALNQIAGKPEPVEPTSTPLGTLAIHWTQFLLRSDMRFKWSELVRQARLMFR